MKKIFFIILGILVIGSCAKPLIFPDSDSPLPPQLKSSSAKLLWIGPAYRVALAATIEDADGIASVQLRNGEWQIDTVYDASGHTTYVVKDTIDVIKDANPTKHTIEFTVTNRNGGVVKGNVNVEDLSAQNMIPGYNPDILPPAIAIAKPTVTKFYGIANDAINVDLDATITDQNIASIEVKVYGETADGQPVSYEETIYPATPAEKQSYRFVKSYSLPAGKPGEYNYVIRTTDASGNKFVKGNPITVGFVDRLYLSDALTDLEVTNQGYDNLGASRGFGTLIPMTKQGQNTFVVDYYYRNDGTENIRFVAFLGADKPFVASNQATANYTLNGANVLAQSATEPKKVVANLASANFKLPVTQKGYYHVKVDMTKREVTAEPYVPTVNFTDANKYPGYTTANPWTYMAVVSSVVVGTAGWVETATSPKLMKEADHPYLYTGEFTTSGNSVNLNFVAPMALNPNTSKGWFRLVAARANMKDVYGDLIDVIGAVGASANGANYGFSHVTAGTFKATYDLALQRLRLVKK